jgi:hypothetical protein
MTITPYPQPDPTVSGANLTVSVFLNTPARVQRAITDFALNRFILDKIFRQGPTATGGAVVYDQVTGSFFFLDRDVQEIRPGSNFPILSGGEQLPQVAVVKKLGGEVKLTYEAVRRDNRALLSREMTRLGNNIVRYVDGAAIAALNAAPILTMAVGAAWSIASTDILADIATAAELVYGPDLGYQADTLIVNPIKHMHMVKNTTLRTALPREDTTTRNPIFGGRINMLEGIDVYTTNRVPAGTGYLLQSGQAGDYSEEIPTYARPIDEPREESWYIHGARIVVPYVTDPLCVVKMTGL